LFGFSGNDHVEQPPPLTSAIHVDAQTKSVLEANARIAETRKSKDWARQVCRKISIEKLTLQESSNNGLQEISDLTRQMA
jgi:hypothetical protein